MEPDLEYIQKRRYLSGKKLVRQCLAWKKKDKSQKPDCRYEDYVVWDCCAYHRQLRDKFGILKNKASMLEIDTESKIFSTQWWADFGRQLGFDISTEILSKIEKML